MGITSGPSIALTNMCFHETTPQNKYRSLHICTCIWVGVISSILSESFFLHNRLTGRRDQFFNPALCIYVRWGITLYCVVLGKESQSLLKITFEMQ